MTGAAFPLFARALFNNLGSDVFPGPRYFPTLSGARLNDMAGLSNCFLCRFGCILLGSLASTFIAIPWLVRCMIDCSTSLMRAHAVVQVRPKTALRSPNARQDI